MNIIHVFYEKCGFIFEILTFFRITILWCCHFCTFQTFSEKKILIYDFVSKFETSTLLSKLNSLKQFLSSDAMQVIFVDFFLLSAVCVKCLTLYANRERTRRQEK